MASADENLPNIGADLHSLAVDSHFLDCITWLKLIYSSRTLKRCRTHLGQTSWIRLKIYSWREVVSWPRLVAKCITSTFQRICHFLCEFPKTETNNDETWLPKPGQTLSQKLVKSSDNQSGNHIQDFSGSRINYSWIYCIISPNSYLLHQSLHCSQFAINTSSM